MERTYKNLKKKIERKKMDKEMNEYLGDVPASGLANAGNNEMTFQKGRESMKNDILEELENSIIFFEKCNYSDGVHYMNEVKEIVKRAAQKVSFHKKPE